MKRIVSLVLVCLMAALLILPASAANWTNATLVNEFDNPPAWYDDAEIVLFGDFYYPNETNARGSIDYVYLKDDGRGDFSVPFEITEAGYYNIGFTLMGWKKSVLRTTNIRVDDADWVYVAYDYVDDDQNTDHFFSGMCIELTEGTHTFTLSLASDFDDTTVKSLYFRNMFFAKVSSDGSETDTPPVTTPPATDTTPADTTPPPATTAPAVTAPATTTPDVTAPPPATTAPVVTAAPAETTPPATTAPIGAAPSTSLPPVFWVCVAVVVAALVIGGVIVIVKKK